MLKPPAKPTSSSTTMIFEWLNPLCRTTPRQIGRAKAGSRNTWMRGSS